MANSKAKSGKLVELVFKNLGLVFSILRWIKPNVVFKGNALITRYEDVTEVLERDWVFQVPYAEKMHKVTNGSNFFLGMQDTERYTLDVSNMRLTARREDINEIITPFVDKTSMDIIAASNGKMDVVQD
ncbi:MAG: cytochrome P450, partial [Betaproteobacteria bacterium]|nr:cytochrome P450 [Betaproteobacteria bacterium]